MKVMPIILIATIALVPIAYVSGYKNGGHDFAHLDHGLMGKISSFQIEYCDKKENPLKCYKDNEENNIQTTLVSHVLYRQNVSGLSEYVFPEYFNRYDGAIEFTIDHAIKSNMKFNCEIFKEQPSLKKEAGECEDYMEKVNNLLVLHSNKSIRDFPSTLD